MSDLPGWTRSRRYELLEPLGSGLCKYLTLHEFDKYDSLDGRKSNKKWRNDVIEIVTARDKHLFELYHPTDEPRGTFTLYHDGIQFNVRLDGNEDGPVIAFCNPLGLDLTIWDKAVVALRSRYRILRYDQRGHGRTSQPKKSVVFSQLADDLASILDLLHLPKLHALIGVSMGGLVTLSFGLRYPERVEKIFPCDFFPSSTPEMKAKRDARVAMIMSRGFEHFAEESTSRWFTNGWKSNPANAEALDAVKELSIRMSPHGYMMNAAALSEYNYFNTAKTLKVPSVLICGEHDFVVASMIELEKAIPGGNLIIIRDCGHLPMVEQPEQFVEILDNFYA
jgi:pimeloyl-ACP methyl ester carboxylesterase